MQKLDKIQKVKVAEQSIEVDPGQKLLLMVLITTLLENLRCQLAVRKEC